jgi:hypothetical protein
MDAREYIARFKAVVQGILGKLRRHEPVSATGVGWENLAPPEPIPGDPGDHAEDFALRYYEPLEGYSRRRMRELGIPENRIGAYDIDFEFRHAAFFPREWTGGENSPGARINLNSGVLNPKLLAHRFGPRISEIWEKGRLRDRMDAVIVHEDIEGLKVAEGQGLDVAHAVAIVQAPDTPRPITEGARRILRAMAEHATPPESLP